MVSIYVGVTDGDWFRFLAQRPDIREVNFWQPVDTRRFGALTPGELFLFNRMSIRAPPYGDRLLDRGLSRQFLPVIGIGGRNG